VFDRQIDDGVLVFSQLDGQFIDDQTSSTWDILGRAFAGPLVGHRLRPLVNANHFWFAWAVFRPETRIWAPPVPATVLLRYGDCKALSGSHSVALQMAWDLIALRGENPCA
jgi:Protein of unknown function (DUF3179)